MLMNSKRSNLRALWAVLLTCPALARADVVWPALYLELRLLTWYAIGAGLLIEFVFLWRYLHIPPLKAALVDVVMNGISSLAGWLLLPWIGLGYEYFPGQFLNQWLHTGTFNPVAWLLTCGIAVVLSTVIEAGAVRWIFRYPLTRRNLLWLGAANIASVAVAFASLLVSWPNL